MSRSFEELGRRIRGRRQPNPALQDGNLLAVGNRCVGFVTDDKFTRSPYVED